MYREFARDHRVSSDFIIIARRCPRRWKRESNVSDIAVALYHLPIDVVAFLENAVSRFSRANGRIIISVDPRGQEGRAGYKKLIVHCLARYMPLGRTRLPATSAPFFLSSSIAIEEKGRRRGGRGRAGGREGGRGRKKENCCGRVLRCAVLREPRLSRRMRRVYDTFVDAAPRENAP